MILSDRVLLLEPVCKAERGISQSKARPVKQQGIAPTIDGGLSLLPGHLLGPAWQAGHQRPWPVKRGQSELHAWYSKKRPSCTDFRAISRQ